MNLMAKRDNLPDFLLVSGTEVPFLLLNECVISLSLTDMMTHKEIRSQAVNMKLQCKQKINLKPEVNSDSDQSKIFSG